MVVHPRSQMRNVSNISSPAVPDRAELAAYLSSVAGSENSGESSASYTPNNLTLKVSCPADGWLLVTDRWATGWRAKVNGMPADVFGGNLIFRAVRVRSGENTVQFYYPQHVYFAMILVSWTTLVAVFAIPRLNAIKAGHPKQLRFSVLFVNRSYLLLNSVVSGVKTESSSL